MQRFEQTRWRDDVGPLMVRLAGAIFISHPTQIRRRVAAPERGDVRSRSATRGAEVRSGKFIVAVAQHLTFRRRDCLADRLGHVFQRIRIGRMISLAVSVRAEVVAVFCMPAQVLEDISAAGNGQGLQRFRLAFHAAFGLDHAAHVVFERHGARDVFANQVNAHNRR